MTKTNNISYKEKIGFMQGRLSPLIENKIQAFPWNYWRDEFEIANKIDFYLMEWTLDQNQLYDNPLMSVDGQNEIKRLMGNSKIKIPSLTGDCFMQKPFYKSFGKEKEQLLLDLNNIIDASSILGINNILIPLVDNGRLENTQHEENLLLSMENIVPLLKTKNMTISFESDYSPKKLINFINKLDPCFFGITYDIGNSAALGFNSEEEIRTYGHRIMNVHIKDRIVGGPTVPLGTGSADIFLALSTLHEVGYSGNYILQTARANDGDHIGVLCKYRDMVEKWLDGVKKHGS